MLFFFFPDPGGIAGRMPKQSTLFPGWPKTIQTRLSTCHSYKEKKSTSSIVRADKGYFLVKMFFEWSATMTSLQRRIHRKNPTVLTHQLSGHNNP